MEDTTFTASRRSERRPLRLALVLLMDTAQGESKDEGYTIDVSQHGCRIEGTGALAEGQFAAGSMGPKIEAALAYLERCGHLAIITSPERISEALQGMAGTRIRPG